MFLFSGQIFFPFDSDKTLSKSFFFITEDFSRVLIRSYNHNKLVEFDYIIFLNRIFVKAKYGTFRCEPYLSL